MSRRERRASGAGARKEQRHALRLGAKIIAEMGLAKEQAIGPDPLFGNGARAERQAAHEEWAVKDREFREAQSAAFKRLTAKPEPIKAGSS